MVLKGGHLPGTPVDLLYDGQGFTEFPGERVAVRHTGGGRSPIATTQAPHHAKGAAHPHTQAAAHGLAIGAGRGPIDAWAHQVEED